MSAPLPSGMTAGVWTANPTAQKLAAHLRFGLLPIDFSIWLCRNEWDANPLEPKTAETIFEGAQAANNSYIQDIPLMRQIVAELDASLQADAAEAWRRVQKACGIFNSRWEEARTWSFLHEPLQGLKQLSDHVRTRGSNVEEHSEIVAALAETA